MNSFKYLGFILTLLLSITLSESILAQENISVSTEIVEIGGKDFYVHTVKSGQTIYSISKAYNVDVTEIYKYNPDSENLISIGQKLKIPKIESKVISPQNEDKPPAKDSGFVYHKVKPGETLYRITQIYGLKEEVLFEYNEGLTVSIYPGQWIKIPEHEKVVADKTKKNYGDNVIEYEVQPKDNFYQLKKKYFVSKEQLENLNPELKQSGLEIGMKILIPKLEKFEAKSPEIDFMPDIEIDTNIQNLSNSQIFSKPCDSLSENKEVYKIGLLMPFHTEFLKDIDVSSEYKIKDESAYPSFEYIHFYEGFLIAADSLAKLGLNLELYVYDTKKDTSIIRKITQKQEFGELDLIFGPFTNEGVNIIAHETRGTKTKIVCPIDIDANLLKENNHLFATIPSPFIEINGMIEYVGDSLNNANFIVLHNNKRNELFALKYIKSIYWKYAEENKLDTNNFYIVSYQNEAWQQLDKILDKTKPNVMLNLVDNEAYISNFVRNLYKKAENYELYLAGTERRWKKYSTLEEKYLVRLNLLLISESFIEYDNYYVKDFIYRFRNEYNAEPKLLAYQGFDLAWHFLNALGLYGTHFQECINGMNLNTLQSKYVFENNLPNAWQNSYVNVYQYDNYKLVDKKRKLVKEEPSSQIGVNKEKETQEERAN